MSTEPEKVDMNTLSFLTLFKQWGPWAIPLGVVCWLVVFEMPAARKEFTATIAKNQESYVSELKAQRIHDEIQTSKLIQFQDVQNKVALENVYHLRRLVEAMEKKTKE
jgi:hypothetical protein